MKGQGPFGGRHSAPPPSQPTTLGQLGVPRGHTPNGGVPYHQPQYQPQPHYPQQHYPSAQMPATAMRPSMHPSLPPMPAAQPQPQPLPPLPPAIAPHAHGPAPSPPPSSKKKEKAKSASSANLGDPQLGFRFKLTFADGHVETMLVDAERALIGSAGHCEVRLPPETAAHEHVEVYAHEGAVHFATKPHALANLPALDNTATMEGVWGTASTLRVGDVSMTVELVSLGMAKAKPPIWALFVAIPAIALTAVGIALARPVDRGWPPIPEAPVLIGPKEAKCPDVASPEQRVVYANERLRVALAKRERSPFAPQEGFESVQQFEVAAACFRASSMNNEAKDADDAADALRVKLDEEYRLRRVRLEHAYRTHQVGPAKRELAVLIPMTSHRRGAYTEWLAALDRAATLEIEDKGRLAP